MNQRLPNLKDVLGSGVISVSEGVEIVPISLKNINPVKDGKIRNLLLPTMMVKLRPHHLSHRYRRLAPSYLLRMKQM
jgi:hypothetical protein